MVKSFNLLDKVLNFSAERYLRTAGDLFIYDGDYESALAMVEKTLELEPSDLRALVLKGDILYCLSRDIEALQTFNQVLKLNPDYVEAHISKAGVLDALGKYREALSCCNKAFALMAKPLHYLLPSLYDQKLLLLLRLKKYREANQCLSQAEQAVNEDEYQYLLSCYREVLERCCQNRRQLRERASALSLKVIATTSS